MKDAVELLGLALVVAGTSMLSVGVGLIVAGVIVVLLMERDR